MNYKDFKDKLMNEVIAAKNDKNFEHGNNQDGIILGKKADFLNVFQKIESDDELEFKTYHFDNIGEQPLIVFNGLSFLCVPKEDQEDFMIAYRINEKDTSNK